MDDITVTYVVNLLKDLSIILITVLVRYILTSYVIALAPIDVLQVVSSSRQNILANLTTTKFTFISNSTITFNTILSHIIHALTLPAFIFLILDTLCYLKAKLSKRNLNY
jgi:hypothetical protein